MNPVLRGALLVAAAVSAWLAPAASAAPQTDFPRPRGPAVGDNAYLTRIASGDGTPDRDDYVASLLAGDEVSVTVTASRHTQLLPRLQILTPAGADAAPRVRSGKGGRIVSVHGLRAAETGRWTIRVSGANFTEGEYLVAFSVKRAPAQVLRHQHLGDDQTLFKVNTFQGLDGASLDLKLTWSNRGLPVEIRSLADPAGRELRAEDGSKAVLAIESKGRVLSLRGFPLHEGDGAYTMRARTLQGAADYEVVFGVTPAERPHLRRPVALDPREPSLDPRDAPLRGRPGFNLRLDGRNFARAPLPKVFFGGKAGSVVSVAADGTHLDVKVPEGVPGTFATVAVQNPDGQAAVRPGYFFFIQPIVITDLVDDEGASVRAGSTHGGRTLHLLGSHFEKGQSVTFGSVLATVTSVQSATEMVVVTPAAKTGNVSVVVVDAFGGIASSDFTFFFKDPPTFDRFPYKPSVAAVNTLVEVTLKGTFFEESDVLTFGGAPVPSAFIDDKTRTFTVPALPAGGYEVTLTDSIGTVSDGPDFVVKPPPAIASVAVVSGPHSGAKGVPERGGAVVQVDGSNFHETDTVTVQGTQVDFLSHTPARFTFESPPGSLGDADLAITDGANQTARLANALRYVGYSDATGARSPGSSSADSLAADRGAIGDLDRDGKADDVVLVTSYAYLGTRTELTRIFFGNSSGALADRTSTNFPATGSDTSGADNWNASAVAIGDVDRSNGNDIVIAGISPFSYNGAGVYKSIRMFRNNGSGTFTQDQAIAPAPAYAPAVFAVDQNANYFVVYGTVLENGSPTAAALGDLDRDGDLDLVVGRDHYDYRYLGINAAAVDFTTTPPSVNAANVTYLSYFQYRPGTKVYDNDIAHGQGFIEKTATAMPSAGNANLPPTPCFQVRDLVLGDVDGDGSLDIVETWDDPTTVTAFGTYQGSGIDAPRVATRILLNSGSARFTDRSSSWLPAGNTPEFWQGSRLALADIDKDGDLDLLLLHNVGTDGFNAKPPLFKTTALRVLRNDRTGTGFVDVTATAIPALPGNGDNFRGNALAVRDVDGDGWPDIVIGTLETLADADGNPIPSTRLLKGGPGLKFTLDSVFLRPASADTGEASDLLLGDLSGAPDPSLILLSTIQPFASQDAQMLRVLDWKR